MEDVTDAAFRALIARYQAPAVTWTEFTSADGLVLAQGDGLAKLRNKLAYTDAERPIVAQLFTSNPEHMETASRMCLEMGFDGVDINMGCPDRAVERQLCGSGMIRHPQLALDILEAARRGATSTNKTIPVSIKTRIGYAHDEIDTWIRLLLEQQLPALTVHLRTRNELSDVPAHWDYMPRIVALRDVVAPTTRIIGNGDVQSVQEGTDKSAQYGCDGVMYGRAIFGNPQLLEHIELFEQKVSGYASDAVMKRHFKAYINGWPGAAELRARLMETTTLRAARDILIDYQSGL
jgi:tRNA-dihydrouridine synthase